MSNPTCLGTLLKENNIQNDPTELVISGLKEINGIEIHQWARSFCQGWLEVLADRKSAVCPSVMDKFQSM